MSGSTTSRPSDRRLSALRARRRLPVGAEYFGDEDPPATHVRVWAPVANHVEVVTESGGTDLMSEGTGYFSGIIDAEPGRRYQFRLDRGDRLFPDPVSRYQPEGPHGPSEIVDPMGFLWTDAPWRGATIHGQVVYEMHVGTFTRAGTWASAASELEELARIGITMIEVMPVADFDGRFGWGYDGVNLFAPTRLYGRPDDFRHFVDTAHRVGVAVILDVVYNHLGAVGNYLRAFAPAYFTDRYGNEWGDAINFDGPDAGPVREFFIANAGYWIDEFHLDGFRLDATQQIYDASGAHILAAIGVRAREAAGTRSVVLVAENEPQDTRLVRPLDEGGYGLDVLWNDDFHHCAMVALTGRAEAYYSDTRGEPQELVSAARYGYLFQGQQYHWQRQPRGTPAWGLPPAAFVSFLQNHDQVANSVHGLRGHQLTSPGRWRALTAVLLLMPSTPMLFQGQEFSASTPFLYFADLNPELADVVRKGRLEFLSQFPSLLDYCRKADLTDPASPATFERCVLDLSERHTHGETYTLHRDLLKLRREHAAFRSPRSGGIDGAVLSAQAFLLRFFTDDHADDRLLIVNLGHDMRRSSFAEPLVAPPAPTLDWSICWSSEDARYGGRGTSPVWARDYADRATADPGGSDRYFIAGESAIVLQPCPRSSGGQMDPRDRTA